MRRYGENEFSRRSETRSTGLVEIAFRGFTPQKELDCMISPAVDAPCGAKEEKLSVRDWVLLPLTGLLSLCILAGSAEVIARYRFSASRTSKESCLVLNDPSTGIRGIPNSTCWEKGPEDQLVEYKFDRCGYRSALQCGPKPPGTYRIVMTGSSLAMGERVPMEQTLAALLPQQLSERTGQKIELYDEGMAMSFPRATVQRFNDVLAQKPDMVLWVLSPVDVENAAYLYAENAAMKSNRAAWMWHRLKEAIATDSIPDAIRTHVDATRTALMLRHLLYENESADEYVNSYLAGPDRNTGFLKANPSPEWQERLKEFERSAADIEVRTNAAGATFAAVLLPLRAQAAMISTGTWPAGYDPYKLGREMRAIVESHGGIWIDVLPDFREVQSPERYFFPVDGHPDARAHAIFSRLIAAKLTSGATPVLKPRPQIESAADRDK
jgi:hypothetical protein